MKSFTKLFTVSLLMISYQIIGKNKERVEFSNDYPSDVVISLIWKNQSFPYNLSYQDALLPQGAQFQEVAAPTSKHTLFSISVSPAMNIPGSTMINFLGNTAISAAAISSGMTVGTGVGVVGTILGIGIPGGSALGVGAGVAAGAATAASVGIFLSGVSLGISSVAKEILRSTNFKRAHPHGKKYFIIEKIHANNDQITIKGYKSKEDYQEEAVKAQQA